jgi:peptidase E
MVALFFLGGEDVNERGSWAINAEAFKVAGGKPRVLVFSWARAYFNERAGVRRVIGSYFKALGASRVDFVDFSDSLIEISLSIEGSDLLYLTGGLTSALLERMRSKDVDSLLHDYDRVIVGRSAGASVMGSRCIITTRVDGKRVLVTVPGFGLVDFFVKAHYRPSGDKQLEDLSRECRIFGVPEGSALVYREGVLRTFGEIYLFDNGVKSSFL